MKRALFRFINLVPAGSRLTILSMGAGEEVREVGTRYNIMYYMIGKVFTSTEKGIVS